ncbi:unnamed protein product [Allacma fusca]|uniref:BED-type domain-containing protein n=1 Tax=Allacma fusca TaxID=39272 RepID=A0A8J2JEW1_9HEXA|nr:unnamed protein product [Allacma fusca]
MEINCENSAHESEDVSDTFTVGSSSSSKNNTKSFRSSIHQHYKLLDCKSKFKCNYCGNVLKRDSTGSTSSLRKHVARSHKSVALKGDHEAKTSQLSIDNFLVMDSRDKFDQHRFKKLLVEFVIDSNQPFSIVNSRKNASGRKATDKIAIITDCWTSKNFVSFHGIIACFISSDWKYEEIMLDFDMIVGHHTGKNLASSLCKVLENYSIIDKVISITCDNASNCDAFVKEFETLCKEKGLQFSALQQRVSCTYC